MNITKREPRYCAVFISLLVPLQMFSTSTLSFRDVNDDWICHFMARMHCNPLQDSGNYIYHQLWHKKLCRLATHCICVSWFELRNGWRWNRGSICGRCTVIFSPICRHTGLSSRHRGRSGPGRECGLSSNVSFLALYLHYITAMSCCSLSKIALVFVALRLELANSGSFG